MEQHKSTDEYAEQNVTQTLAELNSDAQQGLTEKQVREKLARFGYNESEEKEETLWQRLFRRFWGPIPWMIEVAALLSALVEKWEDFIIILIMLAGLSIFYARRRRY